MDHIISVKVMLAGCLMFLQLLFQPINCFNLTILHTNDIHARIEEMNKYTGRCTSSDATEGKCYGGMERLKTKIDEMRAQFPNSLLLDAGDQYQGTMYFHVHGGQVMSHFMDIMGYDAMALGNHEFDLGPSGLEPFLQNVTFDVLSCNIDASPYPGLASIKKSTIIEVAGQKIGIIGYTTESTPIISKSENVVFVDEIGVIRKEVESLTNQGVDKIIAVGHAGFTKDMEIAKKVEGIDLVVGGHSNTFLYTGDSPAHEAAEGRYPTVIRSDAGKDVLVVQDFAYGKYLGHLTVSFDDQGEITSWAGNPILLDNSVAKDPAVGEVVAHYKVAVDQSGSERLGVALSHLVGDRKMCRNKECNMGNVVADAMVRQNLRYADSLRWNHVAVALVNGGSVRASIPRGEISVLDAISVSPFRNTVDIVVLPGSVLLEVLEQSAAGWVPSGDYGGFLQVSGMRVVYDMKKAKGQRVVKTDLLCTLCEVPVFEPLNVSASYKVLVSSFLHQGGDGFSMLKQFQGESHTIGDVDSQLLIDYIKENSPIASGLDGRIQFVEDLEQQASCTNDASFVTLKPYAIAMPVIVATFYSILCVFKHSMYTIV